MRKDKKTREKKNEQSNLENEELVETPKKLIVKKDIIYMAIVTLIYAIVSFINLGSFTNPQTFWVSKKKNDTAIFKINENAQIDYIMYFTGNNKDKYTISLSEDNSEYDDVLTVNPDSVYHWYKERIPRIPKNYKYIKITSLKKEMYIGEIGFYNSSGNLINVTPLEENAKIISDEQDVIPEEISYLNSSYFDEVYFPRTAYEHLHNLKAYEWTHPPLGKLIMAIPIAIFGMTPFAYRVLGNIAGILMLPAMYILAKMLFKKSKYGLLAAIIMALDGMHFVQTRIGTTDSFLCLFILLEYLFMYKYVISSSLPLRKRLWPLFWSGLFMGMAISIKWSGVFAAVGLAIIFFASLIIEIVKNKKWTKYNTIIILCCVVFFILIPAIIYILSYIPFYIVENPEIKDIPSFFAFQQKMFNYHNDLKSTHSYSSEWYTWPITQKSVFYWNGKTNSGLSSKIALLGNPLIFWFSIPCMLFTLIMAISKRKFKYWFLIIAIVSMMVPYLKITRIMFLYHYFPVLPFAMLSIVAFMHWLCEKINYNFPMYGFVISILAIFILFYPIYSGLPVPNAYLENLKWLNTWKW